MAYTVSPTTACRPGGALIDDQGAVDPFRSPSRRCLIKLQKGQVGVLAGADHPGHGRVAVAEAAPGGAPAFDQMVVGGDQP
jgi:hypothetical protein